MGKIQKSIIVSLSLLLTILGISVGNKIANAENEKIKSSNSVDIIRQKKLFSNKNWKEFVKYWKKLNKLDVSKNYENSRTISEEIKADYERIKQTILNLEAEKLITHNEQLFLNEVLQSRVTHLSRLFSLKTCYRPSSESIKLMHSKNELEKQYDILEKLFKENKINSETFLKTKQEIIKNLEIINNTEANAKIDENCSDLLMLLNQ